MEKTYYVYELINSLGTVEYVGMSTRPQRRFKFHLGKKIGTGHGYFQGRQDLHLNLVKSFKSKREALDFEDKMQNFWNLETTKIKRSKSKKGFKHSEESKLLISKLQTGNKRGSYSEEARLNMKKAQFKTAAIIDGKKFNLRGLAIKYKVSNSLICGMRSGKFKNKFNIPFVYD